MRARTRVSSPHDHDALEENSSLVVVERAVGLTCWGTAFERP